MQIRRYRFNRASGKIYRESLQNLIEVSDHLDTIILYATPSVYGQPFQAMPAQDWISLCFLDNEFNWSFALLNSGQSDALRPFLNYQTQQKNLSNQITRINLVPQSSRSGRHWYAYAFEALPLPPEVNPTEIRQNHPELPLIDPTINLDFPEPELEQLVQRTAFNPQRKIKLTDARTVFLSWD